MAYVRITKNEMDEKLKTDKGWILTHSGNEYVYDFSLAHIPVVIKVASSIRMNDNRARNKGADAIRVFAVEKDKVDKEGYKVIRGLVKSKRVYRVAGWKNNLEKAVMDVMNRAKIVYDKYRRR